LGFTSLYDLALFHFLLPDANIFILLCFIVHYTSGPSNSLSRSVRGIDGCPYSHFQDQASLFSDENTLEHIELIFARGELTGRGILATIILGDNDRMIYQKPIIMFRAKEECILSETPCCNILALSSNIFGKTMIEVMIKIDPMTISFLSSFNIFLQIYGSFSVLALSLFSA